MNKQERLLFWGTFWFTMAWIIVILWASAMLCGAMILYPITTTILMVVAFILYVCIMNAKLKVTRHRQTKSWASAPTDKT